MSPFYLSLRHLLLPVVLIIGTLSSPAAADAPHYGRLWFYGHITARFSPELAVNVISGTRTEFSRSGAENKGRYMDELFAGLTYTHRFGSFTAQLALWYYLTGFPGLPDNEYGFTHSLEVVPVLSYVTGPWTLTSRTILHNITYASIYQMPEEKRGYSLVLREMLQARYQIVPQIAVQIADELFFGVIEDGDTSPSFTGFWGSGFRVNRLYMGPCLDIGGGIQFIPLYIYETVLDWQSELAGHGHYLFLNLAVLLDLSDKP